MDQSCRNNYCKKKLTEYREFTSKLYDDIHSIENDIKEKDVFIHKIVKARNDYQKEVEVLKKKNSALLKENNDLLEKNDQLDEDAEDGMKMLKNAHERERKLTKESDKCKEIAIKDAEKIFGLEKERQELQSKYDVIKEKFGKSLRENQELFSLKDAKIKDMEKEILESKEIKEKNENTNAQFDYEGIIQEKSNRLESLEAENKMMKKEKDDLMDELEVKKKEVKDLEVNQNKRELESSRGSLQEELLEVGLMKCNHCSFTFASFGDLKEHNNIVHSETLKADLLKKINNLGMQISEQKADTFSALYLLKEEERRGLTICRCKEKEYCRINHQQYSYIKSKSDDFLVKLNRFSVTNKISSTSIVSGARIKCYTCNKCEKTFAKQGQLKRHKKSEHREKTESGRNTGTLSNRASVIV